MYCSHFVDTKIELLNLFTMKRLLLLFICIFGTFNAFAQNDYPPSTTVNWNGIKVPNNTVIGVSFEVENATFGGLSYEDRCDVNPELKTEFHDAVARCVNEANDVSEDYGHRIYFSTKTEGKEYQFVFIVKSVSTSGHVYADAKLITPSGVATFTNLSGNGGMYGSFMNLMGDGFQSLGKDIAKRILKAKNKGKI